LSLAIEAAYRPKFQKKSSLEILRIRIDVLKHLIRTESELALIDNKKYLQLAEQVVEISKMTNGWINFLTQKEPA